MDTFVVVVVAEFKTPNSPPPATDSENDPVVGDEACDEECANCDDTW